MKGKKREFTDDEIQYIISNWKKESPYSMKKSLIVHGMQFVK